MSTRCHILFRDGGTSLLTYKHFDGYPEGVIPLLREFWKWYPRTEDLEYLTATWFYYCKRQTEEKFCKPQSEEKFKNVDWYDAPMATDELNHNHPVVLSYGVCADGQVHGDTEHFYEVDIENETVTHYTPESWGFLDADSPADIVSQEPKKTYQLTTSNPSNGQTNSNNLTDSQIASDGGTKSSPEQDTTHQDSCERCGSTEGTNWVVQAGTPAGENLNLTDEESVELCDGCMQEMVDRIEGENV
jgi:hypothetical protein